MLSWSFNRPFNFVIKSFKWIGEAFAKRIGSALTEELTALEIDDIYGLLFRFLTEFDVTVDGERSFEIRGFMNIADDESTVLSERARWNIQFARQQMPVAMLKKLIGSPILKNIGDPQKIKDTVDAKFTSWSKDLDAREATANRLNDALSSYATAFNFVGLHQGFDNLSTQKKQEVTVLNRLLVLFGLLAAAPFAAELIATSLSWDRFSEWNVSMLIAVVPAFSLTILLIYFFRIVLRRAEAARSQLLQIELRKTLCQFIQSYADYAKEIKGNSPEALAKFENMIFSGIVSTEDKLPTTFDGIDQLSQLVQSMRGGK